MSQIADTHENKNKLRTSTRLKRCGDRTKEWPILHPPGTMAPGGEPLQVGTVETVINHPDSLYGGMFCTGNNNSPRPKAHTKTCPIKKGSPVPYPDSFGGETQVAERRQSTSYEIEIVEEDAQTPTLSYVKTSTRNDYTCDQARRQQAALFFQ